MSFDAFVTSLRAGQPTRFPADANSLEFARKLDSQDKLAHLREEFIIPTKASLKKTALDGTFPGMLAAGNQGETSFANFHCLIRNQQ